MSGSVDLTLVTGTDWAIQMTWLDKSGNPVPFSSPTMDIRQELSPQGTPIARLDSTGNLDGLVTLSGPGTLIVSMPSSKTRTLPQGTGFWDLFVNYYGTAVRLAFGTVSIVPHVTVPV